MFIVEVLMLAGAFVLPGLAYEAVRCVIEARKERLNVRRI